MKYKLIKKIKGLDWEVGMIMYSGSLVKYIGTDFFVKPLDIALLEHCGFIEEITEWSPEKLKYGDNYWYINNMRAINDIDCCVWLNDDADNFRLKMNNVFQTKEKAQKRLEEIMNS